MCVVIIAIMNGYTYTYSYGYSHGYGCNVISMVVYIVMVRCEQGYEGL